MNNQFSCPGCGAEITFKSLFSLYNTCKSCDSLVVKHGVNLETLGKSTEFPKDLSPLQIGVFGIYQKRRFEILGRQKVFYSKGFWNEWYVYFEDGNDGWLADGQGMYMMCTEINPSKFTLPAEDNINVKKSLMLDNVQYMVDDIKTITDSNYTGELPWYNSKTPKRKSIDLSNSTNAFANIEYYEDSVKVFTGEYIEFNDFKFTNLREIDGW